MNTTILQKTGRPAISDLVVLKELYDKLKNQQASIIGEDIIDNALDNEFFIDTTGDNTINAVPPAQHSTQNFVFNKQNANPPNLVEAPQTKKPKTNIDITNKNIIPPQIPRHPPTISTPNTVPNVASTFPSASQPAAEDNQVERHEDDMDMGSDDEFDHVENTRTRQTIPQNLTNKTPALIQKTQFRPSKVISTSQSPNNQPLPTPPNQQNITPSTHSNSTPATAQLNQSRLSEATTPLKPSNTQLPPPIPNLAPTTITREAASGSAQLDLVPLLYSAAGGSRPIVAYHSSISTLQELYNSAPQVPTIPTLVNRNGEIRTLLLPIIDLDRLTNQKNSRQQ